MLENNTLFLRPSLSPLCPLKEIFSAIEKLFLKGFELKKSCHFLKEILRAILSAFLVGYESVHD